MTARTKVDPVATYELNSNSKVGASGSLESVGLSKETHRMLDALCSAMTQDRCHTVTKPTVIYHAVYDYLKRLRVARRKYLSYDNDTPEPEFICDTCGEPMDELGGCFCDISDDEFVDTLNCSGG